MADKDRDQAQDDAPTKAAAPEPLLSLEQQAQALTELSARARSQAVQLPAVRLDEAGSGYHFVVNGQEVDANGKAVRPKGAYLKGDAED